jgi:hypothetical protein
MMIFRVVEQGWNKSRAVEEAARSGLESKALRKYLDEYLTRPTKNHR